MERLVTTGIIDGKRSRGKQREKMLDNMTSWLHKENAIYKRYRTLGIVKDGDRW